MDITLTKNAGGVCLYRQIKQSLREKIKNGETLPGDILPSIAELTKRYGVSKITVTKALSGLMGEGLLYGKQGKGVFVKSAHSALSGKEVVGVLMSTTGHLYESLSGNLVRELMRHEFFPLVVDILYDRKKGFPRTKMLIGKQPAFLIIDSSVLSFPFQLFDKYKGHIVFIHRFEEKERLPLASYVLSDLRAGGAALAEHLISRGYRRIIHYTFIPRHENNRSFALIEKGIREAIKKHGLSGENLRHWFEESKSSLEERLKKEKMPVAVVADSDIRLKSIYSVAKKLGLRIPRDIALVGWYNTPWAEIFRPKATSVVIDEKLLAEKAVEVIVNEKMQGKTILVKPKLKVRESTGKGEKRKGGDKKRNKAKEAALKRKKEKA